MRSHQITVLLAVAFSCVGCARGTDTLAVAPSASSKSKQDGGDRRCGKGFILTADKTDGGWSFVLYPNWNRGAPLDEISRASGLDEAKEMLGTVASSQEASWMPKSEAPPKATLQALAEHCRKLGLLPQGFSTETKEGG